MAEAQWPQGIESSGGVGGVEAGGWAEAKALGQLRTEAKDYLVQDGDVCHFLHSG